LSRGTLTDSIPECGERLVVREENRLPSSSIVQLIHVPGRLFCIQKRDIGGHAKGIAVMKSCIHAENLPVRTSQAKITRPLLAWLKRRRCIQLAQDPIKRPTASIHVVVAGQR